MTRRPPPEPTAPTNVRVMRVSGGPSIPCNVHYEGTSVGDDGQLMHDWVATPVQRFVVEPGEKLNLTVETLPGRTTIAFQMELKR